MNLRILASGAVDLKQVAEQTFQSAVTHYARDHGWDVQSFRKTAAAGKNGKWKALGEPGWPDLFMWRDNRAIAAELKTERGVATPEQHSRLVALDFVDGITAYLWKPRDSRDILRILA